MSSNKPKLTLIYIDGAGVTGEPPKAFGPITPAKLKPIVDTLTEGGQSERRIFVDDFATGNTSPDITLNQSMNRWTLGGYEAIYCPRVGNAANKETIDFKLIDRVHRDSRLFQASFSLHFVFIVGDVDYRQTIISMLEVGDVSVILTKPNAIMRTQLLHRLRYSFHLFEKSDESGLSPSIQRTARSMLNGYPANMQGMYMPDPRSFARMRAFFEASTAVCPHCEQSFPIGHLSSHHCEHVALRNPPPGITTVTHIEHLAEQLSRAAPEDLIQQLNAFQRTRVFPTIIDTAIGKMPIVSWQVIAMTTLIQQIKSAPAPGFRQATETPEEMLQILIRQGIVMADKQWIRMNSANPFIDRLVEEASQRTFFPLASRYISPAGATGESELRKLLLTAFEHRLDIPSLPPDLNIDELWDSDRALEWLTHPGLDPGTRTSLLESVDDIHTLRYWHKWLSSISSSTDSDLINTVEQIIALTSDTHFLTPNSISILIANGLLTLDRASEALYLNRGHAMFLEQVPLSQRAVA